MRVEEELTEEELLALAHSEEQLEEEELVVDHQEEEARAAEMMPAAVRRYASVAGAVEAVIGGRFVNFEALVDLSDEEREALEALEEVVKGVDGGRFLFAEDRLRALNTTLAVLQPALGVATYGAGVDGLRASFDRVVDEINVLRDRLTSLESAEDEHFIRDAEKSSAEAKPADDDEPVEPAEPAAPAPPVYDPDGPDLPEVAAPPSPSVYEPEGA